MTAQDLKNSILQLAMQGKLVEQRDDEVCAAELLVQIKAEKEKLIKEGKIKKEKPLPEISEDEIPFDIPDSWEWVRLGDIVSVYGGKRIPAGRKLTSENTGHIYIRVSDMKNGSVDLEGLLYVPEDIYPTISKYIINKEDVYITVAGTIGRVGKIPIEIDGANLTENADRLVFSYINQDWLIHCLDSGFIKVQIAQATTQVGQPKLAIKRIEELLIPLPSLDEQKRIVAKIEELMPLVEQYGKAYDKLEQFNKKFPEDMRKSILQYAMQGKLVEQRAEEGTAEDLLKQIRSEKDRLIKEGKIKKEKPLPEITDEEKPFDIPDSWEWVRLENLAFYLDAGKSPNCEKKNVKGDEWGVITTTAIQNGWFDEEQNKVLPDNYIIDFKMAVNVNDVLITRAGPTNRTGVACKVGRLSYNLILSDKTIRINMSDKHLIKDFIVYALNSPPVRSMIIELMSGMDKQQVNISQDKYKTLLIPLPPLAEQHRIVEAIEKLMPYCMQLFKNNV